MKAISIYTKANGAFAQFLADNARVPRRAIMNCTRLRGLPGFRAITQTNRGPGELQSNAMYYYRRLCR